MKPNTLVNPSLPTIPGTSVMPGISSLVRVLAKAEKGTPSPLRYGNRAQAEKKRESLANCLTREGLSSAVVQVESRFLIAIFPAEYDLDIASGKLVIKAPKGAETARTETQEAELFSLQVAVHRIAASAGLHPVRRRPPFATVSGSRINPRNRHNQGNGAKHVIVLNAPSRLALSIASNVSADLLKDEIRRRARLKYKLTGGM